MNKKKPKKNKKKAERPPNVAIARPKPGLEIQMGQNHFINLNIIIPPIDQYVDGTNKKYHKNKTCKSRAHFEEWH